jgi:TetR/AcrR family acrAB operon transcriptional repressor
MRGESQTAKRAEDRSSRQARIEEAAEEVFASRGVAYATMDDIARHSGVSKGALYLHFESKEQLYLSLAVRALREVLARLQAVPSEGTGFQRLQALVESYAKFSESDPARFRLAGAWMSHDWQFQKPEPLAAEYTKLIEQSLALVVNAFELGKADGTVQTHLDTQLTILQAIAGIHGVSDLYLRMQRGDTQVAPQIDQNLWGSLLPSRETVTPLTHEKVVFSHVKLLLAGIRRG